MSVHPYCSTRRGRRWQRIQKAQEAQTVGRRRMCSTNTRRPYHHRTNTASFQKPILHQRLTHYLSDRTIHCSRVRWRPEGQDHQKQQGPLPPKRRKKNRRNRSISMAGIFPLLRPAGPGKFTYTCAVVDAVCRRQGPPLHTR